MVRFILELELLFIEKYCMYVIINDVLLFINFECLLICEIFWLVIFVYFRRRSMDYFFGVEVGKLNFSIFL